MELMRIHIQLGETLALDSTSAGVRMIPFSGRCSGEVFVGQILPGGMDTQLFPSPERGMLSARYMLEGVDCAGKACRLFIDNSAVMQQGTKTVTFPRIITDSEALKWLEAADLTGSIEETDGGLDIVISSLDTETAKYIALRRAGLTLRGCLERKTDKACPLVLLMHGFGGDMGVGEGLYQEMTDRLTEMGMAVLRFDFNGHGVSEGEFVSMTPFNEVEDAAAFLRYAMELGFVTDIYVMGHSQGGVIGGMLAGYYPDVIKKLVMIEPAASLKTDAQQGRCMFAEYDTNHIPFSVNVDGRHNVGSLYFRMAKSLPIYEITGQYEAPALVICGGRDVVVSRECAEKYLDVLKGGTFRMYETLDHGMNGEEQKQMLEQIYEFLRK